MHINNQTHNAELWLCDRMEKCRFLQPPYIDETHTLHWFCVVVEMCQTEKSEHAYVMWLFFRFHFPSICHIHSAAHWYTTKFFLIMHSLTHTHSLTHSMHVCATVCMWWCTVYFRPFFFTCKEAWALYCDKNFVLDNEHENTLSCLRIAYWCAEYCRLTDNRSKRRKGAIIYQMITS